MATDLNTSSENGDYRLMKGRFTKSYYYLKNHMTKWLRTLWIRQETYIYNEKDTWLGLGRI